MYGLWAAEFRAASGEACDFVFALTPVDAAEALRSDTFDVALVRMTREMRTDMATAYVRMLTAMKFDRPIIGVSAQASHGVPLLEAGCTQFVHFVRTTNPLLEHLHAHAARTSPV